MKIAALWGLAEATVFFIVPDVWLSWVGRKNLKRGIRACFPALAGAIVGGILMYYGGGPQGAALNPLLERIPGISPAMIATVRADLAENALLAILIGPLFGIPYKIFAANFQEFYPSLAAFVAISIPARLLRFLAVTTLMHGVNRLLSRWYSDQVCIWIFWGAWVGFYGIYFYLKGW